MKNDKWLMFKNYMHNELGISKEDIRQWINDAVREIAENEAHRLCDGFSMHGLVKDVIEAGWLDFGQELDREIKHLAAKELVDRIQIKLK